MLCARENIGQECGLCDGLARGGPLTPLASGRDLLDDAGKLDRLGVILSKAQPAWDCREMVDIR